MVATHVLDPRTASGDLALAQAVAGGRASALFAVLAGLSIALLTGRTLPVRGRERLARSAALAVRALVIAFVGLLLGDLGSGLAVILTYYGLLFLLALPFVGLGARALAATAAAWMVLAPVLSHVVRPHLPERRWESPHFEQLTEPGRLLSELLFTGYYPVVPWLAYVLAGMALGRLSLRRPDVAAAVAAAGGVMAVVATVASDALTRRPEVVRALLADLPGLGPPPSTGPDLHEQVAGGMFGTTPTGSWQWLLVRAPHSATPFDLLQTTGSALLVVGSMLLLVSALPAFGERLLAVLLGAGAMTFTLYSLHVVLRTEWLWPPDGPDGFVWHVLVLLSIGAAYAAVRRRGPLEAVTAHLSEAAASAVRGRGGQDGDRASTGAGA